MLVEVRGLSDKDICSGCRSSIPEGRKAFRAKVGELICEFCIRQAMSDLEPLVRRLAEDELSLLDELTFADVNGRATELGFDESVDLLDALKRIVKGG